MSEIKSNEIKLPKEILKAERKRANILTTIAVVLSNIFLFYLINPDPPSDQVTKKAKDGYSEIKIEVLNFLPLDQRNKEVTLMSGSKIIANDCYLINCNNNICNIHVPNKIITTLMQIESGKIKMIPKVTSVNKTHRRGIYEFTI